MYNIIYYITTFFAYYISPSMLQSLSRARNSAVGLQMHFLATKILVQRLHALLLGVISASSAVCLTSELSRARGRGARAYYLTLLFHFLKWAYYSQRNSRIMCVGLTCTLEHHQFLIV